VKRLILLIRLGFRGRVPRGLAEHLSSAKTKEDESTPSDVSGRGRRAAALGKDAAGSCKERLKAVEIMGNEEAWGGNRGGRGANQIVGQSGSLKTLGAPTVKRSPPQTKGKGPRKFLEDIESAHRRE
jgi:hypothetical protein